MALVNVLLLKLLGAPLFSLVLVYCRPLLFGFFRAGSVVLAFFAAGAIMVTDAGHQSTTFDLVLV